MADNLQHDEYRAYWEHQATNHPALAHQSGNGQRVFEVIDIEEALGDFRAGVQEKGYIMRLINYTWNVERQGHEVHKIYQGGFIIAKYFSARKGGSAAYLQALSATERIVEDMIEKAIADSRNGHPIFHHSIDSRTDFIVQPVRMAEYAGWRCIFSWQNFFRDCIDDDTAPAWADGGLTPY